MLLVTVELLTYVVNVHLYAQNSLFIAKNCNGFFFDVTLSTLFQVTKYMGLSGQVQPGRVQPILLREQY
jgi:hypothetical protein